MASKCVSCFELRARPKRPRRLVLGVAIMALAAPAYGVTFTVDDVGDAVDAVPGDGTCQTATGVCTLRAAIQEANALPGADRIECLDKLAGTVVLSIPGAGEDMGATGDLDVRDDLMIDGDCERQRDDIVSPLPVDAAGLDRVLHVVSGTVTVRNLSLTGGVTGAGEHGGGILNEADLTLDSPFVFVRGNAASGNGGGLYNAGVATVTNTVFDANSAATGSGGDIFNDGELRLRQAPVSGGTALTGAGIYNRGTLTASHLGGSAATSRRRARAAAS
jgi:CSLREA domain-containing protein